MNSQMSRNEDAPTRKLNRLHARRPRTGRYWCGCCDATLVGLGEKCTVCRSVARPGIRKRSESL